MSRGKKTPSFIHEIVLVVSPKDESVLLKRLDCARQLYNACLGESLRRLDLMRESKAYQEARTMPKPKPKDKGKKREFSPRNDLFQHLNREFRFTDDSIQAFATKTKNACHFGDHLDAHTCQKVATRAFLSAQSYAFGLRGRPRFKSYNQFDSVESKSNDCGIRWRDGHVLWSGLELKALFDPKDKHGVEFHALSCRTKYVRLVRRKIKGRNRFYAQLVQEGKPLLKKPLGTGPTGLDLGPSTYAVVSAEEAILAPFCAELEPIQKEIRRLQRKLDRSCRAFNPEAFSENGTIKPGIRLKKSKGYIKTQDQLAELNRRLAATRKTLQGKLANQVLTMGDTFNLEKISYRAWQKMFGKSVGFRAPGMFVSILRRKAESAGGTVNEFPVSNRLSQTCHQCGAVVKKPLSQRWHTCSCGVHAQRDLYSASLAACVVGDRLDTTLAARRWGLVEPLLLRAVSRLEQIMMGRDLVPSSLGLKRGRNDSHGKGNGLQREAWGVVACPTRQARTLENAA